MIELHDLLSDELDEGTLDNNCSSSVVCTSTSECTSNSIKYNSTNIKQFLKQQPTKYVVVDNQKISHTKPSPCWIRFGLPATKDENDRNIIIKNFASCRSCYTTYSYTYGSTKSLISHKCSKESSLASPMRSPKYDNVISFIHSSCSYF